MPLKEHAKAVLAAGYAFPAIGESLNRLQADLTILTRSWALSEVAAATARELDGSLSSLLHHLREIKTRSEHSPTLETHRASVEAILDDALQATERVRSILAGMGPGTPAPEAIPATFRPESLRDIQSDGSQGLGGRPSGLHRLTPREREVLALVTGGMSNKRGGHELGISTRTFEVHRAHLMEKLGARNAADLVRMTLSRAGKG